jgi:membrane-associated phospholipid phosphatase
VELTLIIAGLLAAVVGLAVAAAYALRAVAVHRHDLAAVGRSVAVRSPARRLLASWEPSAVRIRSQLAPGWLFSVSAVTVAGSAVLIVEFKQALGRPRPPLAGAVAAADGYAFPSAHAAVAAAAFGVLAYLCAAGLRSWAGRVAIWATAAVLAAAVGISRVYLGVHWTTDVLGGWAFGACWAAVVITGWTAAGKRPGG